MLDWNEIEYGSWADILGGSRGDPGYWADIPDTFGGTNWYPSSKSQASNSSSSSSFWGSLGKLFNNADLWKTVGGVVAGGLSKYLAGKKPTAGGSTSGVQQSYTTQGTIPPLVMEKIQQAAAPIDPLTARQAAYWESRVPLLMAGVPNPQATARYLDIATRGPGAYMPDVELMRAPYTRIEAMLNKPAAQLYAETLGPGYATQSGAAEAAAMEAMIRPKIELELKRAEQERAIAQFQQEAALKDAALTLAALGAEPATAQSTLQNIVTMGEMLGYDRAAIIAELNRQLSAAQGLGQYVTLFPFTKIYEPVKQGGSGWADILAGGLGGLANYLLEPKNK